MINFTALLPREYQLPHINVVINILIFLLSHRYHIFEVYNFLEYWEIKQNYKFLDDAQRFQFDIGGGRFVLKLSGLIWVSESGTWFPWKRRPDSERNHQTQMGGGSLLWRTMNWLGMKQLGIRSMTALNLPLFTLFSLKMTACCGPKYSEQRAF